MRALSAKYLPIHGRICILHDGRFQVFIYNSKSLNLVVCK